MRAGKITAKLRDAVKICFMVEGEEVKRYKNIEMPNALKELEIRDFHFNVLTDGKIEFWLHFDQGALPEEWPEPRVRKSRVAKVEQKTPETIETTKKSLEMPVAVATPTPENQPTKRGRKPGSRFLPK